MIGIRDATEADMAAVVDIYNSYLENTTAAWSERLQTLEERTEWFRQRSDAGYPVLVAVAPPAAGTDPGSGGEVVGFTSCGPFRGAGMWPGYVHTAELTIFVTERLLGRGVGDALMGALVDMAEASDLHVLVAGIDAENVGSIRFHERWGFTEVGRMPEVGRKWDRWLDLVLMQRLVD
jgi:L-amino acid N-acyltransferase YncA